MNNPSLKQRAETLLGLHSNGDLLILPNVWNPIGARILSAKGYPAVATASAALSASLGYPIGPGDEPTVRILRNRIPHPINILGSQRAAPLAVLRAIGVNRVSFGPYVFRSCLKRFMEIADGLRNQTGYGCFGEVLSGAEVSGYVRNEPESRSMKNT